MKGLQFTRFVVLGDGLKVFETYNGQQLKTFLENEKRKYKEVIVYQSLEERKKLNIMEKLKMTKGQFMTIARQKFGGENVIMVDGDLFYIKSCNGDWFAGKKILKDLTLSAEDFKINL